jgi:hypothetical protein
MGTMLAKRRAKMPHEIEKRNFLETTERPRRLRGANSSFIDRTDRAAAVTAASALRAGRAARPKWESA